MRNFSGVRITARRIDAGRGSTSADTPAFQHPLLPGEPFDQPVKLAPKSDIKTPFAYHRDRPTPQFLDYASYYVAGVLCDRHGHIHPLGHWPCKRSLDFAYAGVHLLAARTFPLLKQEQDDGKTDQAAPKPGKKSSRKPGHGSGRKPASRRADHDVRRKR